ncbi:MAG: transcriptional repressor [Planctomycetes bacterium]|nr:transcriptional repressor [Planctomycetota bacterium]
MASSQPVRRNTRQRQVVWGELKKLKSHPTASELYDIARQRLPRISLGTVYRNLELLVENGAVRKLEVGGGEARFDADMGEHCHVRCLRCGRVDDLHDLPGTKLPERFTCSNGYDIIGHRLEFIGYCPECKRPEAEKNNENPCSEGG